MLILTQSVLMLLAGGLGAITTWGPRALVEGIVIASFSWPIFSVNQPARYVLVLADRMMNATALQSMGFNGAAVIGRLSPA